MKRKCVVSDGGEVVLYRGADGAAELDVRLDRNTVWLTQKEMGDLFGKDSDTIGLHIRNIFKEKELNEKATTEKSSVVQKEGALTVTRNEKETICAVIVNLINREDV